MNIWQFQTRLSHRLQKWAIFSIVTGLLMRFGNRYWRGMGGQFVGWGLINAAIAVLGRSAADNRAGYYENPGVPQILAKESSSLRRLLLINAGLDVLYVLFGAALAACDKGDGARKGNGRGIILQGAFLFFFDVLHAVLLPSHNE